LRAINANLSIRIPNLYTRTVKPRARFIKVREQKNFRCCREGGSVDVLLLFRYSPSPHLQRLGAAVFTDNTINPEPWKRFCFGSFSPFGRNVEKCSHFSLNQDVVLVCGLSLCPLGDSNRRFLQSADKLNCALYWSIPPSSLTRYIQSHDLSYRLAGGVLRVPVFLAGLSSPLRVRQV